MPNATLVQNNNIQTNSIRTAAILTTSYVNATTVSIEGANQLQILAQFTKGSSDGVNLKIEISQDKSTFFQETSYSVNSGYILHTATTRRLTASGNHLISVPISGKWLKISAQAITSATGTSLTLDVTKANI